MFPKSTKTLITVVAVTLVLLATPSSANAGAGDLSTARAATARFHRLEAANAAGYTILVRDLAGITCIASPGLGVMGIHYVNGSALGDAVLDPAKPEALVYQPRPNGKLRLVALEYIVFQGAWLQAGNTSGPTLFGQPLKLIPMGNRYGLPPFYEIHAWIWQHNPAGIFKDFNPRGTCGDDETDDND
ncbi:MAG: hypothetical protein E6I18_09365 [Chloroflexi bacterium]|nr:MAG: hypothetical protein E6I18_09365 [Chloroflexota bacterium]